MIDKFLVTKKINELRNNLKILHDLKRIPFEKISGSLKEQWTVFYGLQISIKVVIDVGNNMLASIGENQIEDYADIIDKLGKFEIIPVDFAKKIKGMAGLRNILVHEYGIIDIKKIYDILQNNLGDFEDFIFYIKKYLEKE